MMKKQVYSNKYNEPFKVADENLIFINRSFQGKSKLTTDVKIVICKEQRTQPTKFILLR